MTTTSITSTQNPKIKYVLALQQKSSERRKSGLFVVEGRRELEHCLSAGYEMDSLFVLEGTPLPSNLDLSLLPNLYPVSPSVYERLAYRGTTEGLLAVLKSKPHTLSSLSPLSHPHQHSTPLSPRRGAGGEAVGGEASPLSHGRGVGGEAGEAGEPPLFIVLERVEKPGNLGAVLRSADAAAATAVIICDPLTDLYNPNLIRSSIGACFTVPMVACTSEECIAFMKEHGVQILTAQLQDSKLYYDTPMDIPTAIVMGTESTGLTDIWRQAADAHIRIPMLGRLDSLNVSVSAAILLFEAVRQRSRQ